jgi:hypothetical protein
MSEDEYVYQEDFDETELQDSYNESDHHEREEDDEQRVQKINGKMESLQQQVEILQQELDQERRTTLEVRQQYEEELKLAWQKQSQAEEQRANAIDESVSSEQLQKYKKKCLVLEEKLEMALLTGNSSSERIPLKLEEAFHIYCESHNVFPEHADKVLSLSDCLGILNATDGKRKKKKTASNDTVSAPSSADGSALRSSNTVNRLSERVRFLEEELRVAEAAAKDVDNMKNKIFQANDRIRVEKEQKRALEIDLAATKKKVDMLGDHIEKLVVHIKREGAQKIRLAEQLRAAEKDCVNVKGKSDYIQKKSAAKDRLILELREGSKVLEDQLRLMDEKYLELRGKLDYARSIATKKIKKAERTAADLRVKFAMSGSPLVLDALSMPEEYSGMYGEAGLDNDDHGWIGGSHGQPRSALLPPKKSGSVHSMNAKGKSSKSVSLETMSFSSGFSNRSEPTLDGVLDKIKYQTGARQDWTEEKAKLLAKSR